MSGYFTNSREADVSGFVQILVQMLKMMSNNAEAEEVQDFLFEIGVNLAYSNRIEDVNTLAEMHLKLNDIFDRLGFGVCQIEDLKDHVTIRHHDLPQISEEEFKDRWLMYFSVILCGMYNCWFRQTGAPEELSCRISEVNAPADAVFDFRHVK